MSWNWEDEADEEDEEDEDEISEENSLSWYLGSTARKNHQSHTAQPLKLWGLV